jgi:hypothetical protein
VQAAEAQAKSFESAYDLKSFPYIPVISSGARENTYKIPYPKYFDCINNIIILIYIYSFYKYLMENV